MAGSAIIHSLGAIDGKSYYLDMVPVMEDDKGNVVPNPTYKKVVWRVPNIREAVQAEPGYKILSADYSQIEVKLMAYLSGDPVLIAAINAGGDIHCHNAVTVFGERFNFDYDLISKVKKDKKHPRYSELITLRNRIKTVTFGVPYGAGPNKVMEMTGMKTIDEAKAFIDEFFSRFHVLRDWLEYVGNQALLNHFSTSPRGRKRFYPEPFGDEDSRNMIISQIKRWSGNHPIQAGNVDMLKPAMSGIYRELLKKEYKPEDARILFCVHDEIVLTAKNHLCNRYDDENNILEDHAVEERYKAKLPVNPGPIEDIMIRNMTTSYEDIITNIINEIDVAISDAWEKA